MNRTRSSRFRLALLVVTSLILITIDLRSEGGAIDTARGAVLDALGPIRSTSANVFEPIGGAWIQFNIRYYMFALVFVIFDVETVFLYPWAVAFNRLGLLAFIEALIFITILVVALAYAWRKGALEWS